MPNRVEAMFGEMLEWPLDGEVVMFLSYMGEQGMAVVRLRPHPAVAQPYVARLRASAYEPKVGGWRRMVAK